MFAALGMGDRAHAVLVGTGIVDSVSVTRTTLPGGLLDSLVIKIDVGSDTFTALDGGFQPIAVSFNQSFSGDATPPHILFSGNFLPPDDTTFLLPRDFGDPDGDAVNTDTTSQLSSPSINYTTPPITGMFELARLVVPTGADAMVIGISLPGVITLVQSAVVRGTISGTTVAVPEASAVIIRTLLGIGLVLHRNWDRLLQFMGTMRKP